MTPKNKNSGNSLVSRRDAISGLALGGAGLLASSSAPAKTDWTLDLDSAADNCTALLKLQADISGADTLGGFPGEVWAWVPGEGSRLILKTYGLGASHVEFRPEENGWRFYHREVLLYIDPETNEVADSFYNPFTQRRLEVVHTFIDHVSRFYPLDGGRFSFPWEYEINGDNLVYRISVFRLEDNPLQRAQYPLHSQADHYQTGEMWGMIGSLSEVMDPDVTSANCVTSWSRVSGWLPFMEMGNRPGQLIFHSHAYKLREGAAQLPVNIRSYLEKNGPEFFESPKEWTTPTERVTTWSYSKQLIDERRAKGLPEGQTPFGWKET